MTLPCRYGLVRPRQPFGFFWNECDDPRYRTVFYDQEGFGLPHSEPVLLRGLFLTCQDTRSILFVEATRVGFPLPESQHAALELCAKSVAMTRDVIFDHLHDMTAEFVREHKSLGTDYLATMLGFTGFVVARDLFDVLSYDMFGVSSHSQVDPFPHQHCVEEIIETPTP